MLNLRHNPNESESRSARRRTGSLHAKRAQTIGGGFSGGLERDANPIEAMGSIRDAGADTRTENSPPGMAAAIAHDARQPDIDIPPSGQQGHWSLWPEAVFI
jgi:hypothetical protein